MLNTLGRRDSEAGDTRNTLTNSIIIIIIICAGVTKNLSLNLCNNQLKLLTKVDHSVAARSLVDLILRGRDSQVVEGSERTGVLSCVR